MNNIDKKDLATILRFVDDNSKASGINKETAGLIEILVDKYKLNETAEGCSIITAKFGMLGNVSIREVEKFDGKTKFKYIDGEYDMVHCKDRETVILWTDYQQIEPANRQGGLYVGCGLNSFGNPVVEKKEYREFIKKSDKLESICFAVWGFGYNSYWKSVEFGLCIKTDNIEKFIVELREIIGK